jgi:hypothetical protein
MNARWTRIVLILSIVIALGASGAALYLYRQYTIVQTSAVPAVQSAAEVAAIVTNLTKFMELPEDEAPMLATVTDITKLKSNPFFAKAQNGDKVLVYAKSAKAILYRPSTRKVIEISVFNPQSVPNVTETSATKQVQPVRVTLLNGTADTAILASMKKNIQLTVPGSQVVSAGPAKRRDYPDTLIAPVTKSQTEQATRIAKLLDIAVADLPDGETATGSDILIIIGADRVK